MRDESFFIHQVEHIHDLYDDFIFNQNSECYAFFCDLKSLSGCYTRLKLMMSIYEKIIFF